LAILRRQEGGTSFTIDELSESSCYRRRRSHAAPARSYHRALGTLWPLFSQPVWCHAQLLLLGAILAPGAHTVTAALRAPDRRLVLVVDSGFAAVSLALACVKPQVVLISRLRWEALYHRPGPHPRGKRGRKPAQGKRQRSLQGWAARSDTPWETIEVDWYSGQRKRLWGFSHTAPRSFLL
jgi:hypothetical protein